MPSSTTIYRTVVMLAVGAIIYYGWQLYGPSSEQVKSAVVSAVDMAETAWNGRQPMSEEAPSTIAPDGAAPPFANTPQSPAVDTIAPPLATLSPTNATTVPASEEPIVHTRSDEARAPAAVQNEDRLPALMSRLEQLGAAEPKLAPWGSSGNLYRFCCRAARADSPALERHFESVASEPALAVEQVVAKVEAWRTAARNDTAIR